MTAPDTIRRRLVEHIAVLADADAQLRYERDVPHVLVHAELVESFFDCYLPGEGFFEIAFSSEEKKCLAELRQILESSFPAAVSVADLQATGPWQAVMRKAHEAAGLLRKKA